MTGASAVLPAHGLSARLAVMLGAVALGSSLLSIATILGFQRQVRRRRKRALKKEAAQHPPSSDAHIPETRVNAAAHSKLEASRGSYDESLIREQLSRNYSFLGEEGMKTIRDSFVIVVGAGGVGSWTALMLLRSGVGHIRIIDFDQVSLSSLNRHACATLADVGRPKVVCCQQYFHRVAPWADIEAYVDLFRESDADRLLAGSPTYVVDAIDNLDTKVELIKYCALRRIKVFSSMGAGAKADPSRVQISDISTTAEDPLARVVRRELRVAGIPLIPPSGSDESKMSAKASIDSDNETSWTIPCVYSTEKSSTHLLPLPDEEFEKGAVNELAAFEDFRVRILPVLGPIPAMFGLAAATYIICDLAKYKLEPLPIKGRRKLYEKLFADLNVTESRYPSPPVDERTHTLPSNRRPLTDDDVPPNYHMVNEKGPPPRVRIPFSVNDIAYLFEEVFRGRTVVPPFETLSTGQFQRWDPRLPLDYNNVVLFTRPQARRHEQHVLSCNADPTTYWGPVVSTKVQQRMKEELRMSHWR